MALEVQNATERNQYPSLEDVLELTDIEVLHPGGLQITKRIGEIIELEGREVLDVACGKGVLPVYYAKNNGATVTGIDINPRMIESSIERALKDGVDHCTKFQQADALNLPFGDNSFDVVVNECAVGLTPNPQKCLNEMVRVTKGGGNVVIHESTWLKENIPQEMKRDISTRLGTVPFELSEWKEMMHNAGLTNLWVEDWSGLESVCMMRIDRKITKYEDMFSLREKITSVIPRVIRRYGLSGMRYAQKSAQIAGQAYTDGTIGYFLIKGEKSIQG
ncbi:MAG: class I SAM-dependent methyltransferase [Candidatus Thorarchaeota archaeon]|jgi:SAM-dependent methyltransferase